ncbi:MULTISPECIES: TA system VapC family ribonuclease toxin [unclassified Nocardioides]|uniref:TA system VapC family ribonuclease toxin n=1 Tax=unclassified Nocardioides TaxID=2615069 RepID=UPI0006F712C4|nr:MULTISPECIES: TA system VapC family ribonuclease toxin [unclassified Nocardioides]KRA31442.1 hypothetical protein ASD81_18585 [Nocardioides sp. Root614]KRA88062.1 hypothetical protein ASD84_18860 [Nocardioides sp. Root682]
MNVLDVNVVVSLFQADHPHHEVASDWFRAAVGRGETFTVPDVVWVGFVRLVTNPRAFPVAATFDQAWAFVQAVVEKPSHRTYVSHPRALAEFAMLGKTARASGNLVTDSYIAGCAAAYGGTVVTFDRDFRKFDGLRVLELSS